MSTRELLKQFKSLSDADRDRFLAALRATGEPRGNPRDRARTRPRGRADARVTWPDVAARARRIFGRRRGASWPNLVVLERRSESC